MRTVIKYVIAGIVSRKVLQMKARNLLTHLAPIVVSIPILIALNYQLFESPFLYAVILFEAGLTYSFYLLFYHKYLVSLRLQIGLVNVFKLRTLDIAVILLCAFLFFVNLFGLHFLNNVIISTFIVCFALGYAVLRYLNFRPLVSNVEWILLSFFVSIPVNCLLFTISLFFPAERRTSILSFIYLIYVLAVITYAKKDLSGEKAGNIVLRFDLGEATCLILGAGFVLLSLAYTYPEMALLPGLDIVRHYSSALLINTNPEEYSSPYPWFHFQLATVQLLSSQDIAVFQTVMALFGMLLVLAIYLLAKTYLYGLDRRIPALSTVLWTTFSGFGWLSMFLLKDDMWSHDRLIYLSRVFRESFWDVGYGQGPWLWLWFRPFAVGMIGVTLLLYLLKRKDLSSNVFLTVAFLVSLGSCLVHFPEFAFFVVLFSVISLFRIEELRLKDMNISLIGSIAAALGLLGIYDLLGIKIGIPLTFLLLLFAFPAIALIGRSKLLQIKRRVGLNLKWISPVIACVLIAWTAFIAYWALNVEKFSAVASNYALQVPWMFYPVLLGINGFLALIQVLISFRDRHYMSFVALFVIMFVVSVFFGKAISLFHIYQISLEYWERRVIGLVFLASSIISAPALIHIFNSCPKALSSLFLSLMVFSGVTSTVLSVELQHLSTSRSALTQSELLDLSFLEKAGYGHYLLPTSLRSFYVSEYVPFKWRIKWFRYQILEAQSGEFVLNALFSTGYPAIVYTGERGESVLRENYSKSYILLHFLNSVPALDRNGSHLFRLPPQAPPAERSGVVLVLPDDISVDSVLWYGLDFLSTAGYNYTTALLSDLKMLGNAEVLIVPSFSIYSRLLEFGRTIQLPKRVILLNLVNASCSQAANSEENISAKLTVLDLYPHIRDLKRGQKELYYRFGEIIREKLDLSGNYMFEEKPINSGETAAFKRAKVRGKVIMTFETILIKPLVNELLANEEKLILPKNTSLITALDYDKALLRADYAEIIPGKGFYLKILLKNATISFSGGSADLLTFSNCTPMLLLENVETVNMEKMEALVRGLVVEGNGEIEFEDFYAYGSLYREIRVLGEEWGLRGNFTFVGFLGDQYSIIRDFRYNGVELLSSPQEQAELVDRRALRILLIVIIVMFLILIFVRAKEGTSDEENSINRA